MCIRDRLPAKQRTAVVLYYFNGMSTREIASVMGCLEGTVKSRLYTARNQLKQVLESEQRMLGEEEMCIRDRRYSGCHCTAIR